jgi:hypothetical protein
MAETFAQNCFLDRCQIESAVPIQEGRMLDLDPFPKMFDFGSILVLCITVFSTSCNFNCQLVISFLDNDIIDFFNHGENGLV